MATMILLPDGTGVASGDWIAVGESTRHEALESDDGNTSYVQCNDDNSYMIIGFANPDDVTAVNGGVVEADIASIESVRFLSSGKSVDRTDASFVDIAFEAPNSGFSESCLYLAHRTNYTSVNGTARTTDGTHPWTYANLEALEMRCTKDGTVNVYLSYLALEVTYTELSTSNAIFFGANF